MYLIFPYQKSTNFKLWREKKQKQTLGALGFCTDIDTSFDSPKKLLTLLSSFFKVVGKSLCVAPFPMIGGVIFTLSDK